MIEHIWSLPCRLSLTDQESNNITMIEVLEEIGLPSDPSSPPKSGKVVPSFFEIVSLWGRGNDDEPAQGQARVLMRGLDEEIVFEIRYDIDLTDRRRVRAIGKVLGFPWLPTGRHFFQIERRLNTESEWEPVARVPIEIRRESGDEPDYHTGPRQSGENA